MADAGYPELGEASPVKLDEVLSPDALFEESLGILRHVKGPQPITDVRAGPFDEMLLVEWDRQRR